MQSWYCESPSLDVYTNLAAEEWLLAHMPAGVWGLLLWCSEAAVVIGKNQNPWRECDVPWLAAQGVPLARRISGGGAVWHDAGNLNLAFIGPRDGYRSGRFHDLVRGALASLGVAASCGDHHALFVGDRKVSGNAFALRRGRALHHGTLLLDADLAILERALRGGIATAEARGIASRPAPVANLVTLRPGLTGGAVRDALRTAFANTCGPSETVAFPAIAALAADIRRHRSWDWRYGRTPRFTIGGLTVEHGRVVAGCPARLGERFHPQLVD